MRKLLQILELFRLLIILPLNISNGQKKSAYQKIKRQMKSVNLL